MYQRMVFYIYEYVNGEKGGNIGFAKIATQNQQFKIKVHMKNFAMNGKELEVYGFVRGEKLLHSACFGKVKLVNGIGEGTFTGNTGEVWERYRFMDMSGIVFCMREQETGGYTARRTIRTDRFCGTQWDEKGIDIRELDLVQSEMGMIKHCQQPKKNEKELGIEEKTVVETLENRTEKEMGASIEDTESMLEKELLFAMKEKENATDRQQLSAVRQEDVIGRQPLSVANQENVMERQPLFGVKQENVLVKAAELEEMEEAVVKEKVLESGRIETGSKMELRNNGIIENKIGADGKVEIGNKRAWEQEIQETKGFYRELTQKELREENLQKQQVCENTEDIWNMFQQRRIEMEQELHRLKNKKEEKILWQPGEEIFEKYPPMCPFFDSDVLQSVRIEPKDIGVFPMEFWYLANNSFLLHGYYCYRHLLFFKMQVRNELIYAIAIPGNSQYREKFMANMFGFEHFKAVQRKENAGFGYWWKRLY